MEETNTLYGLHKIFLHVFFFISFSYVSALKTLTFFQLLTQLRNTRTEYIVIGKIKIYIVTNSRVCRVCFLTRYFTFSWTNLHVSETTAFLFFHSSDINFFLVTRNVKEKKNNTRKKYFRLLFSKIIPFWYFSILSDFQKRKNIQFICICFIQVWLQ